MILELANSNCLFMKSSYSTYAISGTLIFLSFYCLLRIKYPIVMQYCRTRVSDTFEDNTATEKYFLCYFANKNKLRDIECSTL